MKKEEILASLLAERAYLSRRLSTIDGILDREAFSRGNSSEKEELTEEYEMHEKRLEEIEKLMQMLGEINIIDREIARLENKIDNLELVSGKENEVNIIQERILEAEAKRENIIAIIETKMKPLINNNTNKKIR